MILIAETPYFAFIVDRRSTIGRAAILALFWRIAQHPWIAKRLLELQTEKWLFNVTHPAGRIRQVSLRITDQCNLRCATCGQWGHRGYLHGQSLADLKRSEVSVARYQELFRDLVAHRHHPLVYFWGGEPLLYRGLLDLIDSAAAHRLPPAIATNGTGMADAAARLVNAPLFLLQVSIDGPTAEIHNRIRPSGGNGNNFADIERGLEAVRAERVARRRSLPLIASLTTISDSNANHLANLYRAFADRVDLFVFYLAWWIDEPNALEHERDFSRRFGFEPRKHRGWIGGWKPSDAPSLARQLDELNRLQRSGPPVIFIPNIRTVDQLQAYYTQHRERFGFDQCISIHQVLEVNSNGDVSLCRDYSDYVVGNIQQSTFTELWDSAAARRFRESLASEGLMPVCSRCCGLMGY